MFFFFFFLQSEVIHVCGVLATLACGFVLYGATHSRDFSWVLFVGLVCYEEGVATLCIPVGPTVEGVSRISAMLQGPLGLWYCGLGLSLRAPLGH